MTTTAQETRVVEVGGETHVHWDLTDLAPHIAVKITADLPKPAVLRTDWTYCGFGTEAYVATTYHPYGAGVWLVVRTVCEFAELMGDDWRLVVGLPADDWHDYDAKVRAQ